MTVDVKNTRFETYTELSCVVELEITESMRAIFEDARISMVATVKMNCWAPLAIGPSSWAAMATT